MSEAKSTRPEPFINIIGRCGIETLIFEKCRSVLPEVFASGLGQTIENVEYEGFGDCKRHGHIGISVYSNCLGTMLIASMTLYDDWTNDYVEEIIMTEEDFNWLSKVVIPFAEYHEENTRTKFLERFNLAFGKSKNKAVNKKIIAANMARRFKRH